MPSSPWAHLNCTNLPDSDKQGLIVPTLQMRKLRLRLRRADLGLRHDLLSKSAVAFKCLRTKLQQGQVLGVISQTKNEFLVCQVEGGNPVLIQGPSVQMHSRHPAILDLEVCSKQNKSQLLSVCFVFLRLSCPCLGPKWFHPQQFPRMVSHQPNSPKTFAKRDSFWRLYLRLIVS